MKLAFIKLGGSLITDKAGHESVRAELLARLAAEVTELAEHFSGALVLGHGSGSFGHAAAVEGQWQPDQGAPKLETVSRTQDAAARLHRVVIASLLEAGATPFSVAPGSSLVSTGGHVSHAAVEPIVKALEAGLLPVLFGDVVLDSENGARIFSTERVFLTLATELMTRGHEIEGAYWLGATEGILGVTGELIAEITDANAEAVLKDSARGAGEGVRDVTGGMRHRLATALELGRLGVGSWILDGRVSGLLQRAVLTGEGRATRVIPAD